VTRLLLLRHAESASNAEKPWQGWSDPPLTALGRQAVIDWSVCPPAPFDVVVSSDLTPVRDTAGIIGSRLDLAPVRVCPGLREQDQGAWTGLTKSEIEQRWLERLREHPRHPVSGESASQVLRRVRASLARLCNDYSGQCGLVVTHAGVIREIERSLSRDRLPLPHLEGVQPAPGSTVGEYTLGRPTPGRYTIVSPAGATVGDDLSPLKEGRSA
jgi:broad specificity phosphatase PhoE